MLINQLQELGLSSKEAKVYLSLFKLGPSVASVLARINQIKRTSMYDSLNSLLEKQLIKQFKKGNYNYYEISDTNRIVLREKEKLHIAENITEELKQYEKKDETIQVVHYKGTEGYKEMYEHILKINPSEFIGWIHLDFFYKVLDDTYENNWTKQRIKQDIRVRLIMQDTEVGRKYKSKDSISLRETKLISKNKDPFKTTCLIYNDYITYFDTSSEITGIRIKNPELSKMQKQIFEAHWKTLKS